MEEAKGLVRHVLLVKFKDGTPPAKMQQIIKNFANLNLDQGFTHVLYLRFDSAKGLAEYMDHPVHAEFANQSLPHLDKHVVIDYEQTVFHT
ncbi:hypothetical protein EUGRSUZ_B02213 [Eucalyptus grandis]|uniref:Uncharacterized protein n=2 Tax=Eucalyptus grandis TaxID=71139 RepID=A0ACC3LSW9_EUCGR|nr:hypothetical protein EUGRSUZ_B02213 [Eucalyptus grandis]